MKITALLVLLAVPSSGWAQATRSASLQSDAPVATSLEAGTEADPFLLKLAPPAHQRWYFWGGITLSVVTTAVTALVAGFLISEATRPRFYPVPACGPGACDACIGSGCR